MEKLQAQLTAMQCQSASTPQQVPVFPQQNFMPQPQSFPSAPFYSASSRGQGCQGRDRIRGQGRQSFFYQASYQHNFPALTQQQPQLVQSSPPQFQAQPAQTFQMQTYCWTHGMTNNPSHTSQTCRNPAPGHQPGATLNNTMNGNTYGLPY